MTTYMKLQEELADARHAYIDMKERALAAEAALAERDKPCVCGISHAAPTWGNRYCPNCGHPVEVQP